MLGTLIRTVVFAGAVSNMIRPLHGIIRNQLTAKVVIGMFETTYHGCAVEIANTRNTHVRISYEYSICNYEIYNNYYPGISYALRENTSILRNGSWFPL